MSGNPWTEEEVEVLKKLIKSGHDMRTISQVLKSRTYNGITTKMTLLDLRCIPPKAEIDYDLLKTLEDICED